MNSTHSPDGTRYIVMWLKYCSTFDKRKLLPGRMPGSKVKILKGISREER